MIIEFKTKNKKQLEASKCWLDNITEELVYGGGKGGGKSYLGASLIFGDALIYPETHYFIARKELNDLRKYTIPTIYEVFKNWGLKLEDYASFNGQDNFFSLKNGSKVYLIACKEEPSDPLFERFGSMQMTRGWIEEAGEIAENAKSNLWLSIGRWKNEYYGLKKKLLMTCNPKKGWLKREFVDPFKKNELPENKKFIQALVTDNPYMSHDYVRTLANEKNEIRKARLYKGDWDYDDDKTALLSDRDIASIFTNEGETGRRYMVIDPAFMGKDEAVIYLWEGWIVTHVYIIPETDEETLLSTVDWYARLHSVERKNIVSDASGNGSYLPRFLKGIRGFIGASSPIQDLDADKEEMKKPFFMNLRSQCVWETAQKIKNGKVSFRPTDEKIKNKLAEELEYWRVVSNDDDKKVQIIPKEEVRDALGRSPDSSDCMYMRMFFDLDHEAKRKFDSSIAKKQEQVNQNRPFNKWSV